MFSKQDYENIGTGCFILFIIIIFVTLFIGVIAGVFLF